MYLIGCVLMLRFCLKGWKGCCLHWGHISIFLFMCDWSKSIEALNCTPQRTKEDEQTAFCGGENVISECLQWKWPQPFMLYRNMWWSLRDGSSLCVPASVKPQPLGIAPPPIFSPFSFTGDRDNLLFAIASSSSSPARPRRPILSPLGPLRFIMSAIPFVISGHQLLTRRGGPVKQAWLNTLCPGVLLARAQQWWSLVSGSFISPVGTPAYCGSSVALRWLSEWTYLSLSSSTKCLSLYFSL